MTATTIERPATAPQARPSETLKPDDMFQVVLHNDDWNDIGHVIQCLMEIFGHNKGLATKIASEANERGKAIAEVEGETQAKLHRDQLQHRGLSATVERIL